MVNSEQMNSTHFLALSFAAANYSKRYYFHGGEPVKHPRQAVLSNVELSLPLFLFLYHPSVKVYVLFSQPK